LPNVSGKAQNLITFKILIMGLFSKKKKSVLSLIDFNVSDIDLSTYNFLGNETNSLGTELKSFDKDIDSKINNIFDRIELIEFPNGERNVFFLGKISETKPQDLKKIVNSLVSIYGKDFTNSGKIDTTELNNIYRSGFWTGRTWDKVSPTVSIDGITDETIKLSILGIN